MTSPRAVLLRSFATLAERLSERKFARGVEAFARHRGLDPDAPPNLRKVTETV